jgi:hypothetical protein
MPVVNLTDMQYASITEPKGLMEQILTQPWAWLCILAVVIIIGIYLLRPKNKGDPSTKPFHGREVRKGLLGSLLKRRSSHLSRNVKAHIEKGIARMGIALNIEHDSMLAEKEYIDIKTRKKIVKPDYYYRVDRIQFRKYGLLSYIKALFGFGFEYLILTPDCYTTYHMGKKLYLRINPMVHIIEDSGTWTQSDQRAYNANYELLLHAESENLHGSQLDGLRRLAVHSSGVASTMEKMSHESRLKEEEKQNRIRNIQG